MDCYLRVVPNQTALEPWKISPTKALRLGIHQPELTPGCHFEASEGETIWKVIERQTPWFKPKGVNPFHKLRLQAGQYYPRIARPGPSYPNEAPGESPDGYDYANVIAIARSQLIVLTGQLQRICQTVHPSTQTFETFGHDIRNLLILACTDVEAHWRGVLTANGLKKNHYSTNDYVKLKSAMKLDEYSVNFPGYPWLTAIRPFRDWGNSGMPSKGLKWYSAYNAVKHNRETEFEKATLLHAFEAVGACFIMLQAQFSSHTQVRNYSEIASFLRLGEVPSWAPEDLYVGSHDKLKDTWTPFNFNFNNPDNSA